MMGPAVGHQGGGRFVDVGHGVDGQDRSGRSMVGHQDEGWRPEVHGGDIGVEGLETPAQSGARQRQPGRHTAFGVV
jgi:hypothetical protein